ncbi:endonuclease/exonuclease/phosphatase family protein [Streptosporangium canum]|uniref:endonuclease/exonuclease/phosphatase family protein n=1 Tax=Streptosporangium canum TaxID=324952 RepID=UPI003680E704
MTVRPGHGSVAVLIGAFLLWTAGPAGAGSARIRPRDGFGSGRRDESAAALGAAIAAEKLETVILLGDLNGTLDDRGLAPVTSRMTPAVAGAGFSWPAAFPLARIDHIMTRTATPVTIWTLPATGSDHLPIAARIKL